MTPATPRARLAPVADDTPHDSCDAPTGTAQAQAFRSEKLIRFEHCDPAGIVFYPRYFVMINEVVEDWFQRGLGLDFAQMHMVQRLGIPTARVECEFKAPSRIGDKVDFDLEVQRIGRSSIALAVRGSAGGKERLSARLTVVLTSLPDLRPVAVSDALRAAIEPFRVAAPVAV